MSSRGWKYVDFLGYCSKQKVQELMQRASIGIVLQRDNFVMRQAISTKLFEYMQIACKCNKLNSFSELLNALFIK